MFRRIFKSDSNILYSCNRLQLVHTCYLLTDYFSVLSLNCFKLMTMLALKLNVKCSYKNSSSLNKVQLIVFKHKEIKTIWFVQNVTVNKITCVQTSTVIFLSRGNSEVCEVGHEPGYLPFSFHCWRSELFRFIPVSDEYGALWYYTYPFRFTRVITNVYRSCYVCMHGFQFSTVFCRSACNGHKTHDTAQNRTCKKQ